MELTNKELKIRVVGGGDEITFFLRGERASITVGSSRSCDIRIEDINTCSSRKLFEKIDDEITLFLSPELDGTVFLMDEAVNLSDLKAASVPLFKTSSGKITLGKTNIFFNFEEAEVQSDNAVPTHFPGPFSIVRLKTIGSRFFRSLGFSFVFHLALIVIVMAMPYEKPEIIPRRMYVPANASLGPPIKRAPKGEGDEGRLARIKGPGGESESLLAMIDSRKKIKGFVRNLYFSKSDTTDFKMRERGSGGSESTGGLFTNIGNIGSSVKTGDLGDVNPLFASVEGSGALTKEGSGSFIDSELITEKPQIEGTFNNDAVSQIVAQGEGALRYCYEEALIRDPQAKGRVVVLFSISTEGNTLSASIESSSLKDKLFESCILRKVTKWRFPKPEGGKATVKYPFVFYTTKRG